MSLATLFVGLALAGKPTAYLLPSDNEPDEKELQDHLRTALKVEDLKINGKFDKAVEHPKAIATALTERPTECQVTLKDTQNKELAELAEKDEDVFLVYAASDKVKGAIVWRYQPKTMILARQDTGGGKATTPKPAKAPGKLLLLPGKEARQNADVVADLAKWYGVEKAETLVTDEEDGLRAQLLEHPNKCLPELVDGAAERIGKWAEGVEGDLVLVVLPDDNSKYHVWRWNAERGELLSNEVPQPDTSQ